MDDSQSSLSYCPDFSDICSEEPSFWDFLKKNEIEKEVNVNHNYSKANFCSIEFEGSCNNLYKGNNTSKLKDNLRIKLSDQEMDFIIKDSERTKFDLDKSKKSDPDSISDAVSCEKSSEKNTSKEDEDEFWDFLKSDNSSAQGNIIDGNQRPLSLAELEEIKSLSSLEFSVDEKGTSCIFEIEEHKDWNSATSHEDSILCDKNTSAEILRCMYVIMPEGDYASGQQLHEKKNSFRRGSNEEIRTDSEICKNNTIKLDSISSSDKSKKHDMKCCKNNRQNQIHNFQSFNESQSSFIPYHERIPHQNADIQACNNKITLIEQNSKLEKKCDTNSNVGNNLLKEDNTKSSNTLIKNEGICNIKQTISNQSHPTEIPKSRYENMQLPVISSFYSISSFPGDVFNHQKDFEDKKNILESEEFGENNLEKNNLFTDQNVTVPEEINSYNANSVFGKISNDSSNSKSSLSKHSQGVKRYVQENSPKNSIFRITDCQTSINEIQTFSKNSVSSMSPKRQKTNCAVSISCVTSTGIPKAENDQVTNSTVPLKYIVLPTSTLGTNSTAVPNQTPIYLILPKSSQINGNQNTELMMAINSSNPTVNNVDMKTSMNLNNCKVPVPAVTCSTKIVNSQIPNSTYQNMRQNIQQISLPIINVTNLQMNLNESNSLYDHSQSNLISNSLLQPTVDGTVKLQLPTHAVSKINTFPSTLPQTNIQRENVNLCTFSSGLTSNINNTKFSQTSTTPPVSVLPNNGSQLPNVKPGINYHPLNKIPVLLPGKTVQSNKFIQSMSGGSVPLQRRQMRQQKFKPIKSISLGKDKNAFQQISIPVKMDSLMDPKILNCVYDNLDNSNNLLDFSTANSFAEMIPNESIKVQNSQETPISVEQQQQIISNDRGNFSFAPHKRNSEGILVKRNLITNETEIVKKNQPLNNQSSSLLRVTNSVNLFKNSEIKTAEDKITAPIPISSPQDIQTSQLISVNIPNLRNYVDKPKETNILTGVNATGNDNIRTESQINSSKTSRSTLTTLQELFPPPISMIPVCVMQTVQTINKPTVSKVLVLQSASATNNESRKVKIPRKTGAKKTAKTKKPERKTVKQLLEERDKHLTESQLNQGRGTKILRPVYKLTSDGTWVPTTLPVSDNRSLHILNNDIYSTEREKVTNLETISNKRPNIMILPSATKVVQNNILAGDTSQKDFQADGTSRVQETSYKTFESSSGNTILMKC